MPWPTGSSPSATDRRVHAGERERYIESMAIVQVVVAEASTRTVIGVVSRTYSQTYSRPAKQVLVDSPGRFGFLNLSVAVWNGKDPVLKERLFGLTDGEGNHGEDAKEYWWAVDGTPTHSWMRWLHRYPQAEYPYRQLREANAARGRADREYELAAPPPPVECRVTA